MKIEERKKERKLSVDNSNCLSKFCPVHGTEKLKLRISFVKGTDLAEFEKVLKGENFEGTIVN